MSPNQQLHRRKDTSGYAFMEIIKFVMLVRTKQVVVKVSNNTLCFVKSMRTPKMKQK